MTNINPDTAVDEVGNLSQEQKAILERSTKLSKATPNWRKRLRRTAIATALPLMSLSSVFGISGGDVAVASGSIGDQSGFSETAYRADSLPSYIYENAKGALTRPILVQAGKGVEDMFQLDLGKQLAPELFISHGGGPSDPSHVDRVPPMQINPIEPVEPVNPEEVPQLMEDMIGKLSEMEKMMKVNGDYREKDVNFYDSLHNNYVNSIKVFNGGKSINESGKFSESTEIKAPKINALMAEIRLDQMLGGVVKNE